MDLSVSQLIGLGSIISIILLAFAFLAYKSSRISYLFRASLESVIMWAIVILVIQSIFIIFAG